MDLRAAALTMTGDWLGNVPGPVEGGHCAPPVGHDPTDFIDATWASTSGATCPGS
jgi:hypothetical protein